MPQPTSLPEPTGPATAGVETAVPGPDLEAACEAAREAGFAALPARPVHFVSDIHGEDAAFRHLALSRSGELRAAVARAAGLAPDDAETSRLCLLACYPREAAERASSLEPGPRRQWWRHHVRDLARLVAGMRADRPEQCAPLDGPLETLVFFACTPTAQHAFGAMVNDLVERGVAADALALLAAGVRRMAGGPLHMVGDIWDRGARGDNVVDELRAFPEVDVQWGNHDVCWMGAAAGDPACIATCLRNNVKYGNVAQFEEGYGISLDPLRDLACLYADEGEGALSPLMKAVSALLFKSEGQAIARHPEWHMGDRLLWGRMDLAAATVDVYGVTQPLRTRDFPTFDASDPYAFSLQEARAMDALVASFRGSARLQAQVRWLYDNGSVWRVVEGSQGPYLLFHGCVPMGEDGALAEVDCGDRTRHGRELLDWTDELCRRAWEGRLREDLDWMGFLWTGWQSTFAGRRVKTFERTYLADESTWKEPEDPYYALTKGEDPSAARLVLAEFGVDPARGRIVNGHTPVKLPKGQRPVRSAGQRLVIDGGFCKAYRKATGIAGYTLVDEPEGLRLVTHGDFPGLEAVFAGEDMAHESETIAPLA